MPGSVSSVFGEPEDFEAALRGDGVAGMLITGRGRFRARLTRVELHRLRLAACEEELARIAFFTVPAGAVLVSWTLAGGASPVWGGRETAAGGIVTFAAGQQVHARTGGACCWSAIQAPAEDLARYGRALRGVRLDVPSVARWRPPPAAARDLRRLHRRAIHLAEARSEALADREAAHGLEQQLIHALVECLSGGAADPETTAARRRRGILAGLEELLRAETYRPMTEIAAALGVSERTLREYCGRQLGIPPSRYLYLRRMQQARRALRGADPAPASVAEVAGRYGFRDRGRFAGNYRAIYGEPPSATVRRRDGSPTAARR